jgi:hypothetical protein
MRKDGLGVLLVVSLMLWIPVTAAAIEENMQFDPLPQVGDTMVSGTCDQTGNCNGAIQILLIRNGEFIGSQLL